MATFTSIPVPNLGPGQSCFQLNTGEFFVVEITTAPVPADAATTWAAIKVRAWQVDATGAAVLENGAPVEMPAFTSTVALAALSTGQTTIDTLVADAVASAVQYFVNHLAALASLANLPTPADVVAAAQQKLQTL